MFFGPKDFGRSALEADSTEAPSTALAEEEAYSTLSLPETSAAPAPVEAVPLPRAAQGAIAGEVLASFGSAASLEAFLEQAEANGITVLGVLPWLNTVRLGGSYRSLQPFLQDAEGVDYNYRISAPSAPDPNFWLNSQLEALDDGVLEFLDIGDRVAQKSWGTGVLVAVLDTGILPHAALETVNIRQLDLIGADSSGAFSAHGTAVAGMLASSSDFAPGVAPGVDLLSVKVLNGDGVGSTFTLAEGIFEAVELGAQVINMSLGGYGASEVLRQAILYAAEQGVVLVAPTGNDGAGQVTFPAAYPEVIGVTAVDANGNRAAFANYGEGTELSAPGFQVNALSIADFYTFFNGTSIAAPMVAGMAARLLETGQAQSADEVRQVLSATANDTGYPGPDVQYGEGILNAGRIERQGTPGLHDIALADLYPATEESDGSSFPLYVSVQNRGTTFLPETMVSLVVNGVDYFYRFSGMESGSVQSVQVPVDEASLKAGNTLTVEALATLPESMEDAKSDNDGSRIVLRLVPEG
jgi:hypothetical protein